MKVTFHPLVQKDLDEILDYYERETSRGVADRFEEEFRAAIVAIKHGPRQFPFYQKQRRFRRVTLKTFPHLILYRECVDSIHITVLKHVRRAPGFGLGRR